MAQVIWALHNYRLQRAALFRLFRVWLPLWHYDLKLTDK